MFFFYPIISCCCCCSRNKDIYLILRVRLCAHIVCLHFSHFCVRFIVFARENTQKYRYTLPPRRARSNSTCGTRSRVPCACACEMRDFLRSLWPAGARARSPLKTMLHTPRRRPSAQSYNLRTPSSITCASVGSHFRGRSRWVLCVSGCLCSASVVLSARARVCVSAVLTDGSCVVCAPLPSELCRRKQITNTRCARLMEMVVFLIKIFLRHPCDGHLCRTVFANR